MQKILSFLFIFFYINLFFFSLPHPLPANSSIVKEAEPRLSIGAAHNQQQISSTSVSPLDYVLLQAKIINDPYDKCELLIKIADAYIELGKQEESGHVLNQVVDLAQHIENQTESAILFSKIIEKFIMLDKIDAALNLVRYIVFSDSRNDIMIKIISGYLRQNQYEKALGLAKEIYEPALKALALHKIIDTASEKKLYNQLVKAQKMLAQDSFTQYLVRIIAKKKNEIATQNIIADAFFSLSRSKKLKALVALAEKQIAAGKSSEASETILAEAVLLLKKIKSIYMKDECLAQIGTAYAKMKNYETAYTIADSITIPFSRSELLANIAAALIGLEEFKKASQLIPEISVTYFKEKVITQIIIRFIELGKEQEAYLASTMLNSAQSRSRVYATVVDYCSKKGNFYQAFRIYQKIEDPKIKITTLLTIATKLQKKGKNSLGLQRELLNSLNSLK